MVSIDNHFVWVSYEVRLPGHESMDYSKKFFVVNVPVSLRGVKSLGKESDGVELAFLIPLLKDGANSVSRGIAINRELVFEVGLL